jgi:hypothetical protein
LEFPASPKYEFSWFGTDETAIVTLFEYESPPVVVEASHVEPESQLEMTPSVVLPMIIRLPAPFNATPFHTPAAVAPVSALQVTPESPLRNGHAPLKGVATMVEPSPLTATPNQASVVPKLEVICEKDVPKFDDSRRRPEVPNVSLVDTS